jgi:two-component system NarL family response regulator
MRPATGIRVLIIDDHPVVRHGLLAAVGREEDMVAVGAVANLGEALEQCRSEPPDVILLDLRLPGAPPEQAVRQIRDALPSAWILLLSTDEAGEDLCRTLEAGAAGCVLRTADLEEMVNAIRAISTGVRWIPAEIEERCRAYRAGVPLSEDELVCLRLLADGKTMAQIAMELGWEEREVRDRMRRVRRKLGAKNQTQALVTALQRGIVPLD